VASRHHGIVTSAKAAPSVRAVRTTLQIDDDVYDAARSIAAAEGKSLGAGLSRLAT